MLILKTTKAKFFLILHVGYYPCPDGGIGRRVGLKNQWGNTRAGSTPAPGTKENGSCHHKQNHK